MKTTQRRGLLGLLAALPLAAAAPNVVPGPGRLRRGEAMLAEMRAVHIPSLSAEEMAELRAAMNQPGAMMTLMPGEAFTLASPELAPPGWDTLENVR
jgi:hypothetical protein